MRTLVAILALSPALLHAQAKVPAQPVSTPILLAASSPLTSPSAVPAPTLSVSTGITPAHLIHSVQVQDRSNVAMLPLPAQRKVVVGMTVDASGKPEDLHLLRACDPITGRDVVDAVHQFRFQPATLNGVPTSQQVTLEVVVAND